MDELLYSIEAIGYSKLMKGLEAISAIKIDTKYKVGEYTMSYRPERKVLDSPIINDPLLFKYLKKGDIPHTFSLL